MTPSGPFSAVPLRFSAEGSSAFDRLPQDQRVAAVEDAWLGYARLGAWPVVLSLIAAAATVAGADSLPSRMKEIGTGVAAFLGLFALLSAISIGSRNAARAKRQALAGAALDAVELAINVWVQNQFQAWSAERMGSTLGLEVSIHSDTPLQASGLKPSLVARLARRRGNLHLEPGAGRPNFHSPLAPRFQSFAITEVGLVVRPAQLARVEQQGILKRIKRDYAAADATFDTVNLYSAVVGAISTGERAIRSGGNG